MKKFLTIFFATLMVAALLCGVVACNTTEYNVTFNLNYENSPAVTVLKTVDGQVQYIDEPTRQGYEFVTWCTDPEGNQPFAGGKITADLVLYAKWTVEKQKFTVTYMVGSAVYDTSEVKDGDTETLINYDAAVDERFAGWVLDGTTYQAGDSYEVRGNVTFTADITQLYCVTYVSKGQIIKTLYVAKGEEVTLPTAAELSIQGDFIGWATSPAGATTYDGGYVYTLETADDVTFYARFEGEYQLSFDLGYATTDQVQPIASLSGENVKLPAPNNRDGYRFDGWSDGQELYKAGTDYKMPADDVTLYAVWVKVYTVDFYYNYNGEDEIYYSTQVDENTVVSRPAVDPTRDEYAFMGWYANATLESSFRFSTRINADTKLFAGWQHNYFSFTLMPDGNGYYVSHASSPDFSGIQKGSNLVIPKTYNGLPVVTLLPVSLGNDGYGHYSSGMGPLWRLFTINNSSLNSPFISVTIPDTWTEIPDVAFGVCSTLQRVYFEDASKITRIGHYAFHLCNGLVEFDVPANVTELGEGAFNSCEVLTSLDFSACTISEIPYSAFRNCFALREFKFPQGLEIIGDRAFNSAFLYTTGRMNYEKDVEYNEMVSKRTSYDVGKNFIDLVIPEGVTYIGMWAFGNETGINDMVNQPEDTMFDKLDANYARGAIGGVSYINFYFSHLRSVVIPSSVEYLGRGAFAWCENLESVTFTPGFGDDVLRDYMFYATKLNSAVFPEGITRIEKAVFMHCENIQSVHIPSTVTYIGRRVFAYTSNLQTVTFEKGIQLKLYEIMETTSGTYVMVDSAALFDHSGIQTIEIPASVDVLPQGLFQSCEKLTTVTFEQGSTLYYIKGYAFYNTGLTSIVLPITLEQIGEEAFAKTKLREIYIPEGLSNGDLSKSNQSAIGDTNKLGWYAFADNPYLERVVFAPDCKLEVLSFYLFQNCPKLTYVQLSNNLRSVNGTYATTAYDDPETDVKEGTIWTTHAFDGCTALERIIVPEGNPYIKAVGYALYSRTSTDGEYVNLDWYSLCEDAGGEITVEEGIEYIYDYVFYANKYITKLNIPASVKKIGIASCREMTSLTEVIFAENSQLEEIGNYAFGNATTYPKVTSSSGFESTNFNEPPIKTPLVKVVFTGLVAPKIGERIFVYSVENKEFAIYVPEAGLESYQTNFDLYKEYIKTY